MRFLQITLDCSNYSAVKVTLRERIISIGEREGVDVAIQKVTILSLVTCFNFLTSAAPNLTGGPAPPQQTTGVLRHGQDSDRRGGH